MAGWFRAESDWWPLVAATLTKPWEPQAVWMDLRYWANLGRVPSRRRLSVRWGWGDRRTRNALAAAEVWKDPKAIGSQQGPKRVPKGSQTGEGETAQSAKKVPTGSQKGPKRVHTRVEKQEQQQQQQQAWAHFRSLPGNGTYQTISKLNAKHLNARLSDGYTAEDLILVADWTYLAPDWWPVEMRKKGLTSPSTMWKPSGFPNRLKNARTWHQASRPLQTPPGSATPPLNGHAPIAAQGWARIMAYIYARRGPQRARELTKPLGSPKATEALETALRAIGGREAISNDPRQADLRFMQLKFEKVFLAEMMRTQ